MTDPRTAPRRDAAAGFTLVELMVVLIILAVGVLALSGVQTRSSNDVYKTGRRSRALSVAQQQIEIARAAGYSIAVSDTGVTDGMNWTTQVDSADVDMKRVLVTVSWTESGDTTSLQLETRLALR